MPEPHENPRISPMLNYDDAPAAIDFLCRAFGFEVDYKMEMDDGRIGHAELSYGNSTVMLASSFPEMGLVSPRKFAERYSQIYCVVDDIEAHHETARREGATIAAEPKRADYGGWNYRAVDPEGHRWYFSQLDRDSAAGDDA